MEKLSIIVIDDDRMILDLMENALKSFSVVTAIDIETALKRLSERHFDVALIDVRLDGESGMDLARHIKTNDEKTAIIIHSGYPESFSGVPGDFDGYIMKGDSLVFYERYIQKAYEEKNVLIGKRLKRELSTSLALGSNGVIMRDVHLEQTYSGNLGQSERMIGTLTDDESKIAWVAYLLEVQRREYLDKTGRRLVNFGFVSTVGCGMGCRMCMAGRKKFKGKLTVPEITAQFFHATDSTLAEGMFTDGDMIDVCLNFTCEGDPFMNLDNIIKSAKVITGKSPAPVETTILTSIGIESELRRFLKEYINEPNLRHYWSANSFRPKIRFGMMPGTEKHDFQAILDLYSRIGEKSGEPVTASLCVCKGVNDSDEEVEAVIKTLKGRPFVVKLQGFMPAHNFNPYETPDESAINRMLDHLESEGIGAAKDPRSAISVLAVADQPIRNLITGASLTKWAGLD